MKKTYDTKDCNKCGEITVMTCRVSCSCDFVKCKNCNTMKLVHYDSDRDKDFPHLYDCKEFKE